MVSVSPAEATQQRRGRKSEKELLEAVESAVSNFPELEELEESVLGKLAAVRDLAEGTHCGTVFPTAFAIRSLVLEAVHALDHDLQDVPNYAREMRFLHAYIGGDSVTKISKTLGLAREHVARTVQRRALHLVARAFFTIVKRA